VDVPAADDRAESSAVTDRIRFIFGLLLVTAGAGVFAIAFRATLTAVYRIASAYAKFGHGVSSIVAAVEV
jgi:hypothetical protein